MKTAMQIARMLGKADTYIARIDLQPKSKQYILAHKALRTLNNVYKSTKDKNLKHLIKVNLKVENIKSKSMVIANQKKIINKARFHIKKLQHSRFNYVSPNIVDNTFNAMDSIMYNFNSNSPKINNYIKNKYDKNS